MFNNILRILLLVLVCFSCKRNSADWSLRDLPNNSPCKLYQKEFDIVLDGFKDFNPQLDSFFKTNYKYDLLKIFMKGGNNEESFMKRWFLDENKNWVEYFQKNEIKTEHGLEKVPNEIDSLINLVQEGSFMQRCGYRSNNDTYLFLIQESGEIKFQYLSISTDYEALSGLDKNKISHAIKIFSRFEEGI